MYFEDTAEQGAAPARYFGQVEWKDADPWIAEVEDARERVVELTKTVQFI